MVNFLHTCTSICKSELHMRMLIDSCVYLPDCIGLVSYDLIIID
jgi:hypothetical protein